MTSRNQSESKSDSLLMDAGATARALSIGQRTLWRWVSTGQFPRPDLAIGGKIRRWRRETVTTWVARNATGGKHA